MGRTSASLALSLSLSAFALSGLWLSQAQADTGTQYSAQDKLRNWALSHCLAKAYGTETAAGRDASITASIALEHSKASAESMQKLDAMVDKYLRRSYSGPVQGQFKTKKCLDLYTSAELKTLSKNIVARDR
ncbi:T6SS amidase immunity protein Tai4 family protein [Pokkaliibacter sp. MBI-7]|uniref:T6SS amidase immunity protein Tai4 family protein n=1 Tax=Pokkaliibacter sp. MBI-7 TaxID=3040600 RepID=UPI00244B4190|nr:T6SS amidase immunity protein Tai4 family protein [Pokkaliibacter sp. MBI-7]MDH2433576.1 T6SS amidase immunity protein Tai4 family protein [Pokkaliibacter sp. MBI-7]